MFQLLSIVELWWRDEVLVGMVLAVVKREVLED
jgi:hypothetical protein